MKVQRREAIATALLALMPNSLNAQESQVELTALNYSVKKIAKLHQQDAQEALDYLINRGILKKFKNDNYRQVSWHQSRWGHNFGEEGKPTVEPEQVANRFLLLKSIVERLPKEANETNNRNFQIIARFVNGYVDIPKEEDGRERLLNRFICQSLVIEHLYKGGDLDKLSKREYEVLNQRITADDLKGIKASLK